MFDTIAYVALFSGLALALWSQYEFHEALASLGRAKKILDDADAILAESLALHSRTVRLHDRADALLNSDVRTFSPPPTERGAE